MSPVLGVRTDHLRSNVSEEAALIAWSGDAYRRCFGCGKENPIGLRLAFERADGGARATFRPQPFHQGWDGLLHGGIILTLLDETLAYAALFASGPAVTAEIQARLRRPAPLDQTYTLLGIVTRQRLGLIEARAYVADPTGATIAEASGKFMLMREVRSQKSEVRRPGSPHLLTSDF